MEQAARIILIIIVITEPLGIKTPGLLFIIMVCPPRHTTIPHMHSRLFWRPVKPTLSQTHPFSVKFDRAEPAADAYDDGGADVHVVFHDVTFVSFLPHIKLLY